jgi:hypothetical protein
METAKQPSKGDLIRREQNALFEKENLNKNVKSTEKATEDKSQEPIVGNEVTNKILERYGVDTTTQDKVVESEKESKEEAPAINTIAQVEKDKETVTLTDEDFELLNKAGITEESLDGKTIEEIKEIAQGNKQEQETDTISQDPIVITDEMVKTFGFAKNLVGKTIQDVFQAIDNQNAYISTLEQQKAKPVESTNKQTNDNKEVEETSKSFDLLGLSPDEQSKAIDARVEQMANKIVEEKLAKLIPDIAPIQEQVVQNTVKDFYTTLGTQLPDLPEGVSPEKVFEDWKKREADSMPEDELRGLAKTPNALIKLVAQDYSLRTTTKKVDDLNKTTDDAVKDQSYDRLKLALTNSKNLGSGAKFNFSRDPRNENNDLESDEGTEEQKMIGRIVARNMPK